jgi:hypothetical protein
MHCRTGATASKFAFAQLVQSAGKMEVAQFLRDLILAVPYRIHTVLTDNGVQFTNRTCDQYAFVHIFGVCAEHGIEHRLTKVNQPPPQAPACGPCRRRIDGLPVRFS